MSSALLSLIINQDKKKAKVVGTKAINKASPNPILAPPLLDAA